MRQLIQKWSPICFWFALAVVTVLLLIELSPKTGGWPYWDKVRHLIIFSVLTSLGVAAYRHALALGVALIVYGGIIEVLQSKLTITRMGSFHDWSADIAGVLLVLVIFGHIKGELK